MSSGVWGVVGGSSFVTTFTDFSDPLFPPQNAPSKNKIEWLFEQNFSYFP